MRELAFGSPAQATSAVAEPTLLVVMTDTPERTALIETARERGWQVRISEDAITAQAAARQHQPQIVVVGSSLPAGGPAAAIKRIKRNVHTAGIPVLALTQVPPNEPMSEADKKLPKNTEVRSLLSYMDELIAAPPTPEEAPTEVIADPKRLETLRATNLLDDAFDADLDVLTEIAALVLDSPVALISLVDDSRQYFKSHVGLEDPWASRRETALSHSFCQWVVSSAEPLIVGDAREHPVLKRNLAVRDLGVVAYAGAPVAAGGQVLGSMCAIDSKPRSWSEDDLATLRNIAHVVEAHSTADPTDPSEDARRRFQRTMARGIQAANRLLSRGEARLTDRQRQHVEGLAQVLNERLVSISL